MNALELPNSDRNGRWYVRVWRTESDGFRVRYATEDDAEWAALYFATRGFMTRVDSLPV